MPDRTATRPGPPRSRVRVLLDSDLTAIVVSSSIAMAIALSIGSFVLRGPAFVDEVRVSNSSEYDISVHVNSGDRDGWMALTTVSRRSEVRVVDVIDQGDVWIFRFGAQGREGGELRVNRSDLASMGWVVAVPHEVIEHLRDLGAPPPP